MVSMTKKKKCRKQKMITLWHGLNCKKDWVSSGKGNRKQYYIQEGKNSCRTREILPCKAASVLSMEK